MRGLLTATVLLVTVAYCSAASHKTGADIIVSRSLVFDVAEKLTCFYEYIEEGSELKLTLMVRVSFEFRISVHSDLLRKVSLELWSITGRNIGRKCNSKPSIKDVIVPIGGWATYALSHDVVADPHVVRHQNAIFVNHIKKYLNASNFSARSGVQLNSENSYRHSRLALSQLHKLLEIMWKTKHAEIPLGRAWRNEGGF